MTLEVLLDKLKSCDPMMIILCLLSLIEITPIKISPLTWIGERINKPLKDEIEKIKNDNYNGLLNV